MEVYVQIVKTLQNELNLGSIIIAGHSLGGAIAQSFYYQYPKDVKALILCATGAKLRVNNFILNSLQNDVEAYIKSIPIAAFYRKTDQAIKDKYVENTREIDPEIILRDFKICDQFNAMEKTASIEAPTLIIVGNADKLTPKKYAKYFKHQIDNAELVVMKNAGHMVMLEKPLIVNRNIENFLAKIPKIFD